ncbi:MAG: HsdR family type I site-specific deoxyribonuclease [Chloroflexi bacterium]|nr:HsdR family type I site-specific deoxyribonuclease [Chloroflexota bacterium]
MTQTPSYLEDRISQIPALKLLMAMGWTYLPPDEALRLRGGKVANVILEGVLLPWLRDNNAVTTKGQTYPFSEANLTSAVNALKEVPLNVGLMPASEAAYELLTLGTSREQVIGQDRRSYSLKYIDWAQPARNVYHVTDEFTVERRGSYKTYRPDIVLFVNGIPLVVIECKRPDLQTSEGKSAVYAGVSQMLRNQQLEDGIPQLFVTAQVLLAVSVNEALYGTTRTVAKFWAVWKEEGSDKSQVSSDKFNAEEPLPQPLPASQRGELERLINEPLSEAEKDALYGWREWGWQARRYFDGQGERLATVQDAAIYALLRPGRLLELAYQFILYDNGAKKVARYQQYFAIKATLERVAQMEPNGRRAGGVIWHTTGSGKSLTMVMLAKALALHPNVPNPRVVIVTDRVDLDAQIWKTFHACGKQVVQAESGKHLMELIRDPANEIITTVIDKFEGAAKAKLRDVNPNVFVLVDESHRSQYGSSHARMAEVFPNGCLIGFTGTPLLKKEKSTADKFGGFIHKYTMRQAVSDQAVVPLLYEGRMVDLDVSQQALDQWFERRTATLTDEQKVDLKRKMSRAEEVHQTRARIEAIAWDIAEHYKRNWRKTGFKAQLATASKDVALQYMYALQEERIRCELIMSSPDTREGNEDADETSLKPVQDFWKRMMQMHGTEEKYLTNILNSFKQEDGIEILVVVDKLLVGFDEPRNTVLYVDKSLKEHGLLQAIARVNRLHEGKDYGYIVDYRGVLGELNEAMETYNALEAFDAEDVAGTVTDIGKVVDELPSLHDGVWAVFDAVGNKVDPEAMERYLEPEDRRQRFYDALNAFASGLKVALSSVAFYETTPEKKIQKYKHDLLFFHRLRSSVKLRYAEAVNYGEYEQKIRKLLNDHIKAEGVTVLTPEVNIFDEPAFAEAVSHLVSPASRADAIAYRMKKTATEKMEEDPAFYRKFSTMVEDTIEAYRQGRISELEYLERMEAGLDALRVGKDSSLPEQLAGTKDASAYFGLLGEKLGVDGLAEPMADLAVTFEQTINQFKGRDWAHNLDTVNRLKNALEDHLYAFKRAHELNISGTVMDSIIDGMVETAKKRDSSGL